jgi:hypothetical protein
MKIVTGLLLAATAVLASPALFAQSMRADSAHDWLMLVATNSTDAGKEAEFNAWYDDIDIPDVLEVPGYMRARRGHKEAPSVGVASSAAVSSSGRVAGKYVALYDIESPNIDRTIIDMLMATRKMESRKRSTPLLEVVERLYYRRMASPVEDPRTASVTGRSAYLYLERLDARHAPDLMKTPGVVRATEYELYRVLMVDPIVVPRFLTIYEIRADSAEQALEQLHAGARDTRGTLYLQIKDVKRPAGAPVR